jgi:hypothetical protein
MIMIPGPADEAVPVRAAAAATPVNPGPGLPGWTGHTVTGHTGTLRVGVRRRGESPSGGSTLRLGWRGRRRGTQAARWPRRSEFKFNGSPGGPVTGGPTETVEP